MATLNLFSHKKEKEYYNSQEPIWSKNSYAYLFPYFKSVARDPETEFNGMKVLEIGAGPALYSRLIAECYSPSFVVALDLVPVQFSVYRNEIKKAEISLVGGDCFTLPFPDGSFNIVFGSLILHRFRELNKVLDELYRVLKKNGSYMGIEPAVRNPLHVCRHFFSGHSPNEYFLTIGMFRRAFEKSGFVPLVFGISPKYPFLTNFGMFSCSGIRARKD